MRSIPGYAGGKIAPAKPPSRLTCEELQRKFANRSSKFWAEQRSNLNLVARSRKIDREIYTELKTELRDILVLGILNYPQTLANIGITSEMSLEEKKSELDLNKIFNPSEEEKKFLSKCALNAIKARKQNWQWRISQEAQEKQEEGWHPFFVTLTVDPKKTGPGKKYESPEELWRKGREWQLFVRSLAKMVADVMEVPPPNKPPYTPQSEFVTYAGVIEHGKSREHHHGHFIIWLRAIPPHWGVDPNLGRSPETSTNNECLPMRTFWEWSQPSRSTCHYFRTVNDIWKTEYKFCNPVVKDEKTGKIAPMRIAPAYVAGAYITKYLQKEHKQWKHRMKATRNLGMTRLKSIMRQLPEQVIEALSWRPEKSSTNTSLMTIHSVPLGLLRSEAKQIHFYNQWRARRLDFQDLTRNSSESFRKMLISVQAGARPHRMSSSDFYEWVSKHLPDQKGYSKSRLLAAHALMAGFYPRRKSTPKDHTQLGGNQIGYT